MDNWEVAALTLLSTAVAIVIVLAFIYAGVDMTINMECQALGFHEGHFDLSSWQSVCYYEQLGVPVRELLLGASA